jgi:Protein of unknown function (DUF2911)
MKSFCLMLMASLMAVISLHAQQKPTELDKSPMDISYWPANYPILKMSGKVKEEPAARIVYSRPQKNNRPIFGGIIKYKDLWRLGANEATEIEFFKNVRINGKPIKKGRYTLYCIPDETTWTLIVNTDNYCWGNFIYDSKKDVARFEIPVEKNTDSVEAFTIYFEEAGKFTNLVIMWDEAKASLPIAFTTETVAKKK